MTPTSEIVVETKAAAEARIKAAAVAALPHETGGLLLGYFTDTSIVVEDAIEVVDPDATSSRYTRRRDAAQRALDSAVADAPAHMGYVGDWHSHPAPVDASDTDMRTSARDSNQMGAPLALIVASVDGMKVNLFSYVPTSEELPSHKAESSPDRNDSVNTSASRKEMQAAVKQWWQSRAVSIYLVAVGLVLIILMREAVEKDSSAAAASLAIFGSGALILAAFAPYVEGTLKLGALEMNLRSRLIGAVSKASEDELRAMVTILEDEEISVREVELPPQFAGLKLTDEPLVRMRQDFQLSAIAIRRPGETRWVGGGRISDEPLAAGTHLLLAGPPDAISNFFSE